MSPAADESRRRRRPNRFTTEKFPNAIQPSFSRARNLNTGAFHTNHIGIFTHKPNEFRIICMYSQLYKYIHTRHVCLLFSVKIYNQKLTKNVLIPRLNYNRNNSVYKSNKYNKKYVLDTQNYYMFEKQQVKYILNILDLVI